MPSRRMHREFDRVLAEVGYIGSDDGADSVHNFLDKGASKWGSLHRELDPKHDADMLRPWISAQVQQLRTMKQATATDYVRIAWAHIVLDSVVSREKDRAQSRSRRRPSDAQLDWDAMFDRALAAFERGGFHNAYYRGANRGALEKAKHWLFGRGGRARW